MRRQESPSHSGRRMPFLLVVTLSGWLGVRLVFAKDAVATSPAASLWNGFQTELMGEDAMLVGSWSTADLQEEAAVTRTLLFDTAHTDSPVEGADSTAPRFGTTISSTRSATSFLPTDAVQDGAITPSPPKDNARRRSLPKSVRTTAVLFVATLGLLAFKSMGALGLGETEEHHRREQHQHQRAQKRGSKTVLEQLNELDELHPVAAWLAELVDSDDSRSALLKFRRSVERAKQAQEELSASSLRSRDLPEDLAKEALDSGVAELSTLFELARQHGLSLAQETREVPAPAELSEQELNALGRMDFNITSSIAFHIENLDFSCRAFKRHAERAEKELKARPAFKGLEDRLLLSAVAADLEFIKAAYDAVEMSKRSTVELASTASIVMMSHVVREQMRTYREYRDTLQERRALWRAEKERQQSLPVEDNAVLKELDAVDIELDKGERLLKMHRSKIEQLQKSRNILPAQEVAQQAVEVGQDLKTLLESVAFRMHSMIGVAKAEELGNGGAQKAMKAIASRASEEAAAASKRVADILAEVKLAERFLSASSGIVQVNEQGDTMAKTLVNSTLLKLLKDSLQQLGDNATAAASLLFNVAASNSAEIATSVQKTTMATEEISREAEMLWLHAQFLESVELDMQLSARLAQRVAALAGAQSIPGKTSVALKFSPSRKRQFESLFHRLTQTKATAMSQWSFGDLAATAASMKGAALGLVLMLEGHQLDSSLYFTH